jgi:predicted esterase
MSAREEHIPVTKSARVYSLGATSDVTELWIVCHGYGQLAGRFIRDFESIQAPGRLIVAPEGLHRYYLDPPQGREPAAQRRVGATWMTREDRDTDIADNVRYLDQVVERFIDNPTAVRVHALGFSQGSATAWRWAVLGQTNLAELIIWAGEVPHDIDMTLAAQRLRATRIVFARGAHDQMVPEEQVSTHLRKLDAAGLSYDLRVYDGGHRLDASLLAELAKH